MVKYFQVITRPTAAGRGRKARYWVDNSAVVYIIRSMVTASKELIPKRRLLRREIESHGLDRFGRPLGCCVQENVCRLLLPDVGPQCPILYPFGDHVVERLVTHYLGERAGLQVSAERRRAPGGAAGTKLKQRFKIGGPSVALVC